MISEGYRKLNAQLHAQSPAYGSKGGAKHHKTVSELMARYGAATVLDYGCGKGSLKAHLGDCVTNYDPATFPDLPEPADIVLCADVLEHIEPEFLDDVTHHLRAMTLKAGYFVIACRPATQKLPDGSNTHRIVREPQWWKDRLSVDFKIVAERMLDPAEIALTVE